METHTIYPTSPKLVIEGVDPLYPDKGCDLCPLSTGVRTVCMPPEIYGDDSKGTVLVLGQGPGEMEDRQGRPNMGVSGQYLREQLAKVWEGGVVFDNAVRCRPEDPSKLPSTSIRMCRPYVAQTLLDAKPERIICLGSAAIESIVGRSYPPLSVRRGYTYLGSTPVLFLIHPAAGLRNRFVRGWFEEDLAWAVSARPQRHPEDAMLMLVRSREDALEAVVDLELADVTTWDLETFGSPFNEGFEILNLALTPSGAEYAYVLEKEQLDDPEISGPIFSYLRTAPTGGQNVKFDCVRLRARYGIRVENTVYDTMLWRRILQSDALARLEYQQALIGMAGEKDEAAGYVKAGVAELRAWIRRIQKAGGRREITAALLRTVKVLWCMDGALSPFDVKAPALIGIPYKLASGQNPLDLHLRETPGSMVDLSDWIWLGGFGEWGMLSEKEQGVIQRWIKRNGYKAPKEPGEWIELDDSKPTPLMGLPPGSLFSAIRRVSDGEEPKRYAFAAIPPLIRSRYNAKDTISTERLRAYLSERLEGRPDLKNVWESVVKGMHWALSEMEFNGIAADREAIHLLQGLMAQRIEEIGRQFDGIRQIVGFEDFNPGSTQQVGRLLFGKLGLKHGGFTPTGQYKATEAILRDIDHPVARSVLDLRKATHFKSQYADGMEAFIQDDGRIHPNFNIIGTATGRPSCDSPNLLNVLSAATIEGAMCRNIFVAPPGYVLIEFDQSQIELRIAAMLSGDDVMIDLFRQRVDFHLGTAKLIAPVLGEDPAALTKEHPLRRAAKDINFGVLYGESPDSLGKKLKISAGRAGQIQDAILGKFAKLRRWIAERLIFSRRTGTSRTWWGGEDFRERQLWRIGDSDDGSRENAERASCNSVIQGTAAEYTNASLPAVQRWIEDELVPAKMILTVYDSVLLEVREDAVDEVVDAVPEIMMSWPVKNGVPLKVDCKIGTAWGSMEERE
jgi:uracil-DNA glycosylase family 4